MFHLHRKNILYLQGKYLNYQKTIEKLSTQCKHSIEYKKNFHIFQSDSSTNKKHIQFDLSIDFQNCFEKH